MIAEAFLHSLHIPDNCKAIPLTTDTSAIRIYGKSAAYPVLYQHDNTIEVIARSVTLRIIRNTVVAGQRMNILTREFDLNNPETTIEVVSNVISELVEVYFEKS